MTKNKLIAILIVSVVAVGALAPAALAGTPPAQDYFNKASVQYMSGDFTEALKYLTASLKADPNYQPALEFLQLVKKEQTSLKMLVNQKLNAGE